MVTYNTPCNLIELLNKVLRAASRTEFYKPTVKTIKTVAEFSQIPTVPLKIYREQKIADIVTDLSKVDWIVGPFRGSNAAMVPVLESPDQTEIRYDLLSDALRERIEVGKNTIAVAITSNQKIGFAAEIATILTSLGVPTHLVSYTKKELINRFINITRPQVVILLSEHISEDDLPNTVKLCITFRKSHIMTHLPQLDVYVVDEIGFMAQSNNCKTYLANKDVFYFEESYDGYLIVTALNNYTRPLVRIKTEDTIDCIESTLRFRELGNP